MILSIFWLTIATYIVVMAVRTVRYGRAARVASRVVKPYTRTPKNSSSYILILGDSTMYGAGTNNPELTIGGLLATKYPKASIETLAVNGAKVRDLPGQLSKASHKKYDLILIGIGGNDIVQMSTYSSVRHELVAFLSQVNNFSSRIVLCHSVNIGNIGFFLFPLNYFYDYRSRKFSELCKDIAAQFSHVTYVNFYRPIKNDHYDKTTRKKFIAGDGFHANDYANKYFFDLLWQQIKKS